MWLRRFGMKETYDYYRIRVNIPRNDEYMEMIGCLSSMDTWNRNEYIKSAILEKYNSSDESSLSALIDACREGDARIENKIDVLNEKITRLTDAGTEEADMIAPAIKYLKKFRYGS
jgi:hypothetical protein